MIAIKEQIQCLELALLQRDHRQDQRFLDMTLADDFEEIDGRGVRNKYQAVREWLLRKKAEENWYLHNFTITRLSADVLVANYSASHHRHCETTQVGSQTRSSLRSSIWRRKQSSWELVFHQVTNVNYAEKGV